MKTAFLSYAKRVDLNEDGAADALKAAAQLPNYPTFNTGTGPSSKLPTASAMALFDREWTDIKLVHSGKKSAKSNKLFNAIKTVNAFKSSRRMSSQESTPARVAVNAENVGRRESTAIAPPATEEERRVQSIPKEDIGVLELCLKHLRLMDHLPKEITFNVMLELMLESLVPMLRHSNDHQSHHHHHH